MQKSQFIVKCKKGQMQKLEDLPTIISVSGQFHVILKRHYVDNKDSQTKNIECAFAFGFFGLEENLIGMRS